MAVCIFRGARASSFALCVDADALLHTRAREREYRPFVRTRASIYVCVCVYIGESVDARVKEIWIERWYF